MGNLGKQSRKLCNWNQWHNQTNITIFFVQFGIQLCCFLPNCDRNSEAQQAAAHTKTSARPHLHLHDSNNSIKTESKNFCQHLLLNDNLLGFSAFSQNISRLKCCSKGDPSYFSTIMQITNNSNHCTMWYVAIPCLVWKNSSTIIGSVYSVWKWAWIDAYWEKSFIVVAGGRGRWPVVVAVGRKPVAVGRWRVAGGWSVAAACGASKRAKYSLPVWAGRNVNQFFSGNEDASDFTMTWSWDAGTTYLLKSSLMVFHDSCCEMAAP